MNQTNTSFVPLAKQWLRRFSFVLISLIFYFLISALIRNWHDIEWDTLTFNYFYLFISVGSIFVAYLISIYTWKLMMTELGEKITYSQAFRVMGKSQLGKYLPGGVWMVASRVYLAEQEKLSKSKVLISSLVEQVYVFVTASILSILFLGLGGSMLNVDLASYDITSLLIIVIVANPFSINVLMKWGMGLLRIDPKDYKFSLTLYLILIVSYSLCWLLQGVGFFYLVKSFYPVELSWFKRFAGIYFSSWLIGFLAIFAPGGLGIREGYMTLLLQGILPTGIAVTVSLVSRIWILLLELLLAGLTLFSKKRD